MPPVTNSARFMGSNAICFTHTQNWKCNTREILKLMDATRKDINSSESMHTKLTYEQKKLTDEIKN